MPSRCFCLRGSRWADCRGLRVRGEWWDFRFNLTGAKLKLLIPPAARRPLLLSPSVSVRDEDSWRDRRSRSDLPYSEMWRGWIQSVIPSPPDSLCPSWSGATNLTRNNWIETAASWCPLWRMQNNNKLEMIESKTNERRELYVSLCHQTPISWGISHDAQRTWKKVVSGLEKLIWHNGEIQVTTEVWVGCETCEFVEDGVLWGGKRGQGKYWLTLYGSDWVTRKPPASQLVLSGKLTWWISEKVGVLLYRTISPVIYKSSVRHYVFCFCFLFLFLAFQASIGFIHLCQIKSPLFRILVASSHEVFENTPKKHEKVLSGAGVCFVRCGLL